MPRDARPGRRGGFGKHGVRMMIRSVSCKQYEVWRRAGRGGVLRSISCALVFGALAACASDGMRPQKPVVMTGDGTAAAAPMSPYSLTQFEADKKRYDAAALAATQVLESRLKEGTQPTDIERKAAYASASFYRDVMINRIRADIRDHSGTFEETLRQNIAEWATSADFVELGLAAATTITGGESAKTVLAAILTAIKGARLSVDKNFFRERTTEAIISALRSTRLAQDAAIVGKMSDLGADKYTFEEAWNDLVDLYYAGTLTSGFQTLAEEAGAKAIDAEQKKQNVDEQRSPTLRFARNATADEVATRGRLIDALQAMTEEQARAILTEVGATLPTNGEFRQALQSFIQPLTDPADPMYQKLTAAYNNALGAGKW